jgi:hypothetical protein
MPPKRAFEITRNWRCLRHDKIESPPDEPSRITPTGGLARHHLVKDKPTAVVSKYCWSEQVPACTTRKIHIRMEVSESSLNCEESSDSSSAGNGAAEIF